MTTRKPAFFQVIKATQRHLPDISLGDKTMQFGEKFGAFSVHDPGLAAEIEKSYGPKGNDMPGQVVVAPIYRPSFSVSVPELPWKVKRKN